MKLLETLKAARALVENQFGQRYYAQDKKGRLCSTLDPKAAKFCGVGALAKVLGIAIGDEDSTFHLVYTNPAYTLLTKLAGSDSVSGINDHKGLTAVLALYDRAIQEAEHA